MSTPHKGQCKSKGQTVFKIPLVTTDLLIGSLKIPPLIKIPVKDKGEFDTRIEGAVRLGLKNISLPVPACIVNRDVGAGIKRAKRKVGQFSAEKKALHHFVVRELPKRGAPIALKSIAAGLDLPLERVARMVTELEQSKTFLFRKNSDRIDWAYPVTVEETPHKVTFSTGETINAA